ncbi:hypothetical protein BDW59DRAFT_167449 [Aspergillus cavernicola]|uniref:Uncharacterized protein n=1 Tax=Aspergillus cavernicola TaxID=176166 RepID=A0ABR4HE02_9EURO
MSSQPPTQTKVDEQLWKLIGHDGYSTALASIRDFCNSRQFARLNNEVILRLEDELDQMEGSLMGMDRSCGSRGAADIDDGSLGQGTKQARADLLAKAS